MGLGWTVTSFFVLVQVAAAGALLRSRLEPRRAIRILAAVFLLNAVVTALMTLPWYGPIYLKSDPGWATKILRAFDAPTGPFLVAFLAARSERAWGPAVAKAFLAVGVLLGLAEIPFSGLLNQYDTFLRSLPFYAAIGVGSWVLAAGRTWERWVALALLARALYWGTAGVLDLIVFGLGDEPGVVANRLGLVALTVGALAAAARLGRHPGEPHMGIAAPVLLIGPGAVMVESVVRWSLPPDAVFRYGSVLVLNLLTLALVRPILVVHGVAPDALVPALARAGVAALAAVAAGSFVAPIVLAGGGIEDGALQTAAYGVGLLVGFFVLAMLEMGAGAPAASPTSPAPAAPPRRPELLQWQQVLLALRGSCLPPGAPPQGDDALTQRALVARTGILASRVSAVVRELNETAAARLDAYVPDWRSGPRPAADPQIIQQLRGSVPGRAGVWLYYRLTPLGERLAEAIARSADAEEKRPETSSGASP